MTSGTVHIVGAGLAGLSAAVKLAGSGREVVVHELARYAGGRCRSYFEPALGLNIDNGNHLLLSANRAALALLKTIASEDKLVGPERAEFAFADLVSGESWTLRPNRGPIPWWIFASSRRAPGTRASDYLALAKLLRRRPDRPIADVVACEGPAYDRVLHPILLAALNTDPPQASASLARAVLRETLARGGAACRPLVAVDGLGAAFIDPALAYLERKGAKIHFHHQLRGIDLGFEHARALDFSEDAVTLGAKDAVILAVPAAVATLLLPGLSTPTEFHAIVNAHLKVASPQGLPRVVGVLNGIVEWLFAFPGRLSVTISCADRFIEADRDALAEEIWRDVVVLTGIEGDMPPFQIVKERRATFAATPEQNRRRPHARTRWRNLVLAGDWTATGLPATIEGAVRSGNEAARLVLKG
jgi:squalene-associated FAD-dependent desaturase